MENISWKSYWKCLVGKKTIQFSFAYCKRMIYCQQCFVALVEITFFLHLKLDERCFYVILPIKKKLYLEKKNYQDQLNSFSKHLLITVSQVLCRALEKFFLISLTNICNLLYFHYRTVKITINSLQRKFHTFFISSEPGSQQRWQLVSTQMLNK